MRASGILKGRTIKIRFVNNPNKLLTYHIQSITDTADIGKKVHPL